MRLGCFVIHGDSAETLGACLDDLLAIGDEVVAVDSGSRDGSAAIVRQKGVRAIPLPWQGYGAARAAAAAALTGCDYLFYLDADERLREGSREAILEWKRTEPRKPFYRLKLHDWAELGGRRFEFRMEWKKRFIRADLALWKPSMIIHEALPDQPEIGVVSAAIDHRFATSLTTRLDKEERYATLWAVQQYAAGARAPPWNPLRRPAHWFRNALLKGALFRGGWQGARLSWTVSRYHERKQELLREIARGAHAELVATYRSGELRRLFERLG
jgi:(heptosyl)LPS beta-1,4-glucosyltransferase